MKKLILSIFLFLAIFSPVYAAEGSYTSAKYHYCQYGASNTCYLNSNTFSQNLGTMTTFDPYDILQSFGFTFTGSYSSDNTYSVTAVAYLDYIELVTEGNSTYSAFYIFSSLIDSYTLRGCTTTGTCNNWINISPIAIASITQVDNSNYRIEINFTFKSNVDLKQVDINYIFNQDSPLYSASYLYQFRVNTIDITYEEGTSNQLLQQQIANQQATNQHLQDLQKEINDLNNNSTNNTNNIINNQQQNTQDILDSNQATQDTINNNFNDCHTSYNLFNGQYKNVGLNIIKDDTIGTVASLPNLLSSVVTPVIPGKIYSVSRNQITPRFTIGFSNALTNGSESYTLTSSTSNKIENIVAPEGYSYMIIYLSNSLIDTSNLEIMVNEGSTSLPYEPYGEEICSNRLDNVTGSIDNVNDSLNNSNTSDAENDASNFFNNFTDSDNGGLSGIITSPLIAINKMLDSQCSPLTATYKNKTISLSCGTEFWAKATGIKEFLNLVEGGLLCYLIIRKLYLLVQDLKNPDNDRVEVMKL